MDNPYADGRAIHPYPVMNEWISSLLTDVVFPRSLQTQHGLNNVVSVGGADLQVPVAEIPSNYGDGLSVLRTGTGFPLNGHIFNIKTADETLLQVNFPYQTTLSKALTWRGGEVSTGLWSDWRQVGGEAVYGLQGTGFSQPAEPLSGLRARREGAMTHIEGYLIQNVAGAITNGTVIATFPLGYRPVSDDAIYAMASAYLNSGAFLPTNVGIDKDGNLFSTGDSNPVARIYVNMSFSSLEITK
jgi:hypothetical protein